MGLNESVVRVVRVMLINFAPHSRLSKRNVRGIAAQPRMLPRQAFAGEIYS